MKFIVLVFFFGVKSISIDRVIGSKFKLGETSRADRLVSFIQAHIYIFWFFKSIVVLKSFKPLILFVTCKYVSYVGLFAIGVNVQTREEVTVKLLCETFIVLLLILLIIKIMGKFDSFLDGNYSCTGCYEYCFQRILV